MKKKYYIIVISDQRHHHGIIFRRQFPKPLIILVDTKLLVAIQLIIFIIQTTTSPTAGYNLECHPPGSCLILIHVRTWFWHNVYLAVFVLNFLQHASQYATPNSIFYIVRNHSYRTPLMSLPKRVIPLILRLVASICCKKSFADRHSVWSDLVLHFLSQVVFSTRSFVSYIGYHFVDRYGWLTTSSACLFYQMCWRLWVFVRYFECYPSEN